MLRGICLVPLVAALLGTGCERAGAAPGGKMVVDAALARVMPSGSGAVYFKLTNGTGMDDRLVQAQTPGARDARLHEIVEEEDVLRMVEATEGFEVEAGSSLLLEQGGKHLMLYGAQVEGAQMMLTLHFARAGPLTVEVPVRRGFAE